jgi:phage terminase large subunit-like protein
VHATPPMMAPCVSTASPSPGAPSRAWRACAVAKAVTHDGDPRMAAHIAHCVAKLTPMGDLVSKDKRGSPRKFDASVAAIVAHDTAAWYPARNRERTWSFA